MATNKSNSKTAFSLPNEFYSTLVQVISSENDSLLKLSNNLDNQYNVLINQKLTDFIQILKQQKNLIAETQQSEKQKFDEIKSFLPGSNDMSLQDLIVGSPEEFKDTLSDLKRNFDLNLKKIESKKNRNKLLIQKSLDLIQNQIKYLRDLTHPGYDSKGNREGKDLSYINKQV